MNYKEFLEWKTTHEHQLIDVREEVEHQTKNIGGLLIPLGEIMKRQAEIRTDIPVVFYCKRGIRSQIAIQKLKSKIEGEFINLSAGISDVEV